MATNILLVDDNELNRDMLSQRLQRKGFVISIAVDGQEAVDLAKSTMPDLILMDMGLPIMDGCEATRNIKGFGETHKIPIIGLSAHAMLSDKEKAIQAGCDDYETKPVDFPRLLEKIQQYLDQNPKA